ncbi:MAG TPA: right-handed parallel beta-helix repeat-containing protein [Chitinophagales bacterium]|nr:right-handed parallel beta-helix repeat-containing protein [Chitinophagales bacterium]HRK26284.1 right-handed parallel beta-helix repeat-containing protein [Chitinophagales bacterium]
MKRSTQVLAMLFGVLQVWVMPTYATVRYVKPVAAGLGTGVSWEHASDDLTAMLLASEAGDEVWVAAGTYKPTAYPPNCVGCSSVRNYTFFVNDGVSLYGGFAGNETNITQRNITANTTTLDGNVGISSWSDNSNHVLMAIAPTNGAGVTINGFTVKNASGWGAASISVNGLQIYPYKGGGAILYGGTNTITNNTFMDCQIDFGGGIYIAQGINNYIAYNKIWKNNSLYGGGIYIESGTNTIVNNEITDNRLNCCAAMIENAGAGIVIWDGENLIANNNIHGNSSYEGSGCGVTIIGGTNAIYNNTIKNNQIENEGRGAGISLWSGSNNTIAGNFITDNSATYGGGIHMDGGANIVFNNVIYNNSANSGGGMYITGGQHNIINNTIVKNSVSGTSSGNKGGGIYTAFAPTTNTLFANNILWANKLNTSETTAGADYFHYSGMPATFLNNLLQLPEDAYTTVNNDLGALASGNVFAQSPMFAYINLPAGFDGILGSNDDGLRLLLTSPAVNAGIAIGTHTTDLLGIPHFEQPDIGAYEYPIFSLSPALYVDAGITEPGNGGSWQTALNNLSDAIELAYYSPWVTTIYVAEGIYKPEKKPFQSFGEINTNDPRDVCFHLPNGLKLQGGYPTGGGTRDIAAHPTILCGDIGILDNPDDNAYHVVLAKGNNAIYSSMTLDGFTIRNGNANGTGSVSLQSTIFFRNSGAGLYGIYGDILLQNNIFTSNNAADQGGAICAYFSECNFYTNTVFNNRASTGGGMHLHNSTGLLRNNVMYHNTATVSGGGLYKWNNTVTLTNNVLLNNESAVGGGIYALLGTCAYINNTLVGNRATLNGGGLYTNQTNFSISNNLFWANALGENTNTPSADFYATNSTNTFLHNLLQLPAYSYSTTNSGNFYLGAWASGNLFAQNPMFVDAQNAAGIDSVFRTEDDGLKLLGGSPAIQAGIASANNPITDILGNSRSAHPDLGAYEVGITIGISPVKYATQYVNYALYPNPVVNNATLTFTSPTATFATAAIYSLQGNQIFRLFAGIIQANIPHKLVIDAGQLASGRYAIVIDYVNCTHQDIIPLIVVK